LRLEAIKIVRRDVVSVFFSLRFSFTSLDLDIIGEYVFDDRESRFAFNYNNYIMVELRPEGSGPHSESAWRCKNW